MLSAVAEQLTAQFYRWEQLGRGWHVYDVPVELEPPFYPFPGHSITAASAPELDDVIHHTLFSSVVVRLKRWLQRTKPIIEVEDERITPNPFTYDEGLKVYSVILPEGIKVATDAAGQLLTMLSDTRFPVSFEITADHNRIGIQVVCRESEAATIFHQLKAYFPESTVREAADRLNEIMSTNETIAIQDYGLSAEFMLPLAMVKDFEPDPLTGLCAVLETLQPEEHAAIQILFQGTEYPWTESMLRAVTDNEGGAFFPDAPDMVKRTKEKTAWPLFGVTVKVLGAGKNDTRAITITEQVGKVVSRILSSSDNQLMPLDGYPVEQMADDLVLRQSCRQGMLLNTRELATLVHLPSVSIRSAGLERNCRKTKAAPLITEGQVLVLGMNEHQGLLRKVTVSNSQRLKHTHIIGATGTGKSTLLESMIAQDLQAGRGVAVLDPHGDLIESLLRHVPATRMEDVIVVDPSDAAYPVGFNILTAHSEVEKDILSSDLVAVFRRLSASWGDQMNSVLANAILAFLESSEGGTLADLRRFLVEKSFRDRYLTTVSDPAIVYYWQKEYPLLKSGSIGPILTRLDTFLRPKLIRNMVAQKKSLDFEQLLDTNKILLVKLSQGLIGIENSFLLGTFFVSKMYQAATARQIKRKDSRSDYFLYIDEFQNFITPSMSAILSSARKYHLGMTLVHQEMHQLVKYDAELANSVVANAGTRICFRLGDADAKRFSNGFSFFEAGDLETLSTGQAIGRIERPDFDFSLDTIPVAAPETTLAEQRRSACIEYSRTAYATPVTEVEQRLGMLLQPELKTEVNGGKRNPLQAGGETKPKEELTVPTEPPDNTIRLSAATSVTSHLERQRRLSQHRFLQMYIKRIAEARGYKVLLEQLTPDGKGRVDVSLEQDGRRIACEICVTSPKEWEVHNIQKCWNAGYETVITCSSEKRTLKGIKAVLDPALMEGDPNRAMLLLPEEVAQYLDSIIRHNGEQQRAKGYRIKVNYKTVTDQEMAQKKVSVGKRILNSSRGSP